MKENIRSALYDGFTEPVRDPLWGHIYLSPGLLALTESAPFMRLHRIMQLGPTYRVYPGATHTRAGHSLGVYHLARRLLIHLAEKGADSWLSPGGVRSFLCAALLHDLGHFPYTHSLKELPLEEHETLTGRLILSEPVRSLAYAAGAEPEFAAAIVDTKTESGDEEILFYRRLLSGSLDPDKLDYLSRDGRYCGVPYGAQDVDFVFSRLHPHRERGVDIDHRGIPGVESLLFSKYLMYRSIYWHKAVRSATAMVKKALLYGLNSGLMKGEELYHLDDQGLYELVQDLVQENTIYLKENRGGENRDKGYGGAGNEGGGRDEEKVLLLVDAVKNGRLYECAAEIKFDEELHSRLPDLSLRSGLEANLAAELSGVLGREIKPRELIVDLPEPVSFESGLFVLDEDCSFAESSSAFKSGLVENFVSSLRIIRIFIDGYNSRGDGDDEIGGAGGDGGKTNKKEILQICEKWLKM